MNRNALADLICGLGQRMHARNLIAGADGNLSCRLDDGHFLVTRSGVSKGFMSPRDIVVADASGALVEGEGKVSSEFFTHLAMYEARAEVMAVVHAHPPVATALTLAGISLLEPVLPELVMNMGGVPTCAYATPGTREGADAVRAWAGQCDVLLLDRHGALCAGSDLVDAYHKLERLEHAAQTLWHALALGTVSQLSAEQVGRIHEAGRAYGVKGQVYRG